MPHITCAKLLYINASVFFFFNLCSGPYKGSFLTISSLPQWSFWKVLFTVPCSFSLIDLDTADRPIPKPKLWVTTILSLCQIVLTPFTWNLKREVECFSETLVPQPSCTRNHHPKGKTNFSNTVPVISGKTGNTYPTWNDAKALWM
jgi:hypothetical protein